MEYSWGGSRLTYKRPFNPSCATHLCCCGIFFFPLLRRRPAVWSRTRADEGIDFSLVEFQRISKYVSPELGQQTKCFYSPSGFMLTLQFYFIMTVCWSTLRGWLKEAQIIFIDQYMYQKPSHDLCPFDISFSSSMKSTCVELSNGLSWSLLSFNLCCPLIGHQVNLYSISSSYHFFCAYAVTQIYLYKTY